MFDRLLASPGFVSFVRARSETFGIGVSWVTPPEVDIPAYAGIVNLKAARPLPTSTPEGGG
jgi:hypothetical protein